MATPTLTPRDAARQAADLVQSARSLAIDGREIPLSDELKDGLRELLRHIAAGDEVDVVARPEYLSTQQAAEILRVSRPTLVKMLDEGLIRYERPGTHRRIPKQALEEYLVAEAQARKQALEDLAETFDSELPDEVVSTR
ncbi:helix-turn-helix domain-containing protein [Nesterenkonia alkaliphila]|uniref:Excisionase family DNA-binding protein n=1 Tax=Nesterenkonia alkaliphila TaxID=1463631 RepID=A0A7K1UEK8_9MICC|nr:helix-turn-helix domain-containing protein [Nesterenkonia alkaliphila]MVT24915.1 excisionase family DNA-binding protein [Nesterenkonia alkaliphila]GFZ86688.1 excisionase [Nesterenkonia alkaliphila]